MRLQIVLIVVLSIVLQLWPLLVLNSDTSVNIVHFHVAWVAFGHNDMIDDEGQPLRFGEMFK